MRKVAVFLIFFLTLFSLSFSVALNVAFAASNADSSQELSIKESTESAEVEEKDKKIEYQLPYPGLLPDNPLYFLKALRDAVVDFLISDPLKKANFYLLQADKRLNAGVYLFKKGKEKVQLAQSTISKGENYFEKAISKAIEAKQQGMNIDDISRGLRTSSRKHKEVIKELAANADAKTKESLMALVKRAADFEKKADSLTPK